MGFCLKIVAVGSRKHSSRLAVGLQMQLAVRRKFHCGPRQQFGIWLKFGPWYHNMDDHRIFWSLHQAPLPSSRGAPFVHATYESHPHTVWCMITYLQSGIYEQDIVMYSCYNGNFFRILSAARGARWKSAVALNSSVVANPWFSISLILGAGLLFSPSVYRSFYHPSLLSSIISLPTSNLALSNWSILYYQ